MGRQRRLRSRRDEEDLPRRHAGQGADRQAAAAGVERQEPPPVGEVSAKPTEGGGSAEVAVAPPTGPSGRLPHGGRFFKLSPRSGPAACGRG
ncbi:hypothetical protein CFHF_00110 [Caulobacter flavus]|uniref:Uncharacterized protein n=1 Tax=Caulobacter flavus TaxID=1679497 RepID=A0A2N5D7D3_9CAUL|nr:hypothetical protein C1707_04230 [Caulobacter flavus]PLR21974.1 hypothetical protein CFHF_00110 [Caulobacter flavus]